MHFSFTKLETKQFTAPLMKSGAPCMRLPLRSFQPYRSDINEGFRPCLVNGFWLGTGQDSAPRLPQLNVNVKFSCRHLRDQCQFERPGKPTWPPVVVQGGCSSAGDAELLPSAPYGQLGYPEHLKHHFVPLCGQLRLALKI